MNLVLIVQQLALRRTLHTRQPLTAVHDQYNAWAGFGAACFTLLKQYHLPVSVWSIVAVGEKFHVRGRNVKQIKVTVRWVTATTGPKLRKIKSFLNWYLSCELDQYSILSRVRAPVFEPSSRPACSSFTRYQYRYGEST